MTSIDEGRAYTLRYVPSEDAVKTPGEVYATWSGKNESIKTGARVPSLIERQSWWLTKAQGGQNWHILGESPLPEEPNFGQSGPARLGFSNAAVKNGAPVLLSTPSSYMLKNLGGDLYTIAPTQTDSGSEGIIADLALGVSDDGEGSQLQVMGGERALPKWSLQKID